MIDKVLDSVEGEHLATLVEHLLLDSLGVEQSLLLLAHCLPFAAVVGRRGDRWELRDHIQDLLVTGMSDRVLPHSWALLGGRLSALIACQL